MERLTEEINYKSACKGLSADKIIRHILLKRATFVRGLHAVVTFTVVTTIITAIVLLFVADIDWGNAFLAHGYKYCIWLFSFWISAFQVIYFNIYFIIDVIENYARKNAKLFLLVAKLHDVASYVLFAFVFPFSLLVTIMFWTFYFTKRHAMYPEIMDTLFPPILNHMCHTFPIIFVIIYMFIENEKEPSKKLTLAGLLTLLLIYGIALTTIKKRDGKWVYLVIETLTPFQVKCLFGFCIFGSISFLFLGYFINSKMKVFREKINFAFKKYSVDSRQENCLDDKIS